MFTPPAFGLAGFFVLNAIDAAAAVCGNGACGSFLFSLPEP